MRFLVVGCSYRTAPLAIRERLAFPLAALPAALAELRAITGVQESLILSTCNRVEVYAVGSRPSHIAPDIRHFLARSRGVDLAGIEAALYGYEDSQAVKHIFRVASSLDAMVVGEAQIGGQVKEAYAAAARSKTLGPFLSRCMHRAFAVAKRIRNETDIARHPVSVSSVAADLARRVFGDLTASTVLVVGAGEMAELAVRHLLSDGAGDIRVVNRTYEHAVQLAFQLGAKATRFEDLRGQLLLADIVISSTGSPQPIISRRLLTEVMRERKQRPLFIVDIAVPRDVDREANTLPNVYLFDVDDLDHVVAENLKERCKEAHQAERILAVELQHFEDWLRRQDAVPVIKQLREHFLEVVQAEATHTAQSLNLTHGKEQQLLDTMVNAIVNKLLHRPTMELKDQAKRPNGALLAEATRQLFHLASPEDNRSPPEIQSGTVLGTPLETPFGTEREDQLEEET